MTATTTYRPRLTGTDQHVLNTAAEYIENGIPLVTPVRGIFLTTDFDAAHGEPDFCGCALGTMLAGFGKEIAARAIRTNQVHRATWFSLAQEAGCDDYVADGVMDVIDDAFEGRPDLGIPPMSREEIVTRLRAGTL